MLNVSTQNVNCVDMLLQENTLVNDSIKKRQHRQPTHGKSHLSKSAMLVSQNITQSFAPQC